ncbi:MAG TPA: GNAT family N-acetyltransferase [Gemmatimonadales bacterium]|nr:GNAT family N-acetyltransferase [Gemmatimonadales bacterium]
MSVRIVPFSPSLAPAFASLNRAWIERLFSIEPADLKVLDYPEGIINMGGQIFFAIDEDLPIGTVAAIRVGAGSFELAKMAVSPTHQGRGIGRLLGEAVIEWAQQRGATKLVLLTNSSLEGAIRLYQRLGFRRCPFPSHTEYARADVYMELTL